jgi:AraC-like DNA-binding protein
MGAYLQFEYFVSFLSAVVALVLYFAHRERQLSHRILAVYFLCLAYMLFMQALVRYGHIHQFPHLWRTTVFAGMLNPVLAFIYVRSVIYQKQKLGSTDILLLCLPVALALSFTPLYILPAEAKQKLITEALANKSIYFSENEGLLPSGLALTIRIILAIALAVWQCVLLFRWHQKAKSGLLTHPQNQAILRWLSFFTSLIMIAFPIMALQYFFQMFQEEDFYWIISSTAMLAVSAALWYVLLRPNVLYGLHGWVPDQVAEPVIPEVQKESIIKRESLLLEHGEEYRERIEQYLDQQKPFLRHSYRIANLAADTHIPLYQLSAFINQQYGQSFTEWINGHRIRYIRDELVNESNIEAYTLEALAKRAGFNSRSTFIAAVKKQTGQTPSLFFQNAGIKED